MIVLGGGHPDDLTGYIGPRGLYDRYMRGEVVTRTDALFDQSEWVIIPESELGAENRRRLWWMMENLERIHGKVRRRRSAPYRYQEMTNDRDRQNCPGLRLQPLSEPRPQRRAL